MNVNNIKKNNRFSFEMKPVPPKDSNFKPENVLLQADITPKHNNLIEEKKTNRFTSPFYKEKRIYIEKPVYETFEQIDDSLKEVFNIAVSTLPPNIDWITLKRFLNDKTSPRKRWLWGFSLRHRGTEKIQLNNNDIIYILEWFNKTGYKPLILSIKIYNP